MTNAWRYLIGKLRRLRVVEDGVAAVEFALILPVMLLVYVGSVEATALISMDRRVQTVTGSLGDLVARANADITVSAFTDYFRAAGNSMTPYSVNDLKQVVTQVYVSHSAEVKVVWSRQYVKGSFQLGTDYAVNATFKLPQEMVDIALGKYVIVAESTYEYLPLYGIVFDKPIRLHRDAYFMPRFGGSITIK